MSRRRGGEITLEDGAGAAKLLETPLKAVGNSSPEKDGSATEGVVDNVENENTTSKERNQSRSEKSSPRTAEKSRADRSDPSVVPSSGQFFLHDNRSSSGGGRSAGKAASPRHDDDGRNKPTRSDERKNPIDSLCWKHDMFEKIVQARPTKNDENQSAAPAEVAHSESEKKNPSQKEGKRKDLSSSPRQERISPAKSDTKPPAVKHSAPKEREANKGGDRGGKGTKGPPPSAPAANTSSANQVTAASAAASSSAIAPTQTGTSTVTDQKQPTPAPVKSWATVAAGPTATADPPSIATKERAPPAVAASTNLPPAAIPTPSTPAPAPTSAASVPTATRTPALAPTPPAPVAAANPSPSFTPRATPLPKQESTGIKMLTSDEAIAFTKDSNAVSSTIVASSHPTAAASKGGSANQHDVTPAAAPLLNPGTMHPANCYASSVADQRATVPYQNMSGPLLDASDPTALHPETAPHQARMGSMHPSSTIPTRQEGGGLASPLKYDSFVYKSRQQGPGENSNGKQIIPSQSHTNDYGHQDSFAAKAHRSAQAQLQARPPSKNFKEAQSEAAWNNEYDPTGKYSKAGAGGGMKSGPNVGYDDRDRDIRDRRERQREPYRDRDRDRDGSQYRGYSSGGGGYGNNSGYHQQQSSMQPLMQQQQQQLYNYSGNGGAYTPPAVYAPAFTPSSTNASTNQSSPSLKATAREFNPGYAVEAHDAYGQQVIYADPAMGMDMQSALALAMQQYGVPDVAAVEAIAMQMGMTLPIFLNGIAAQYGGVEEYGMYNQGYVACDGYVDPATGITIQYTAEGQLEYVDPNASYYAMDYAAPIQPPQLDPSAISFVHSSSGQQQRK